jgi:hypothetical protein
MQYTSYGTGCAVKTLLRKSAGLSAKKKEKKIIEQPSSEDCQIVPNTVIELANKRRANLVHAKFGSKNEYDVAKKYCEDNCLETSKGRIKSYYDGFIITGFYDGRVKKDGINHIIEIKTRCNTGFGMSKKERIQCLCYCYCALCPGLIFIECNSEGKLKVTESKTFYSDNSIMWARVLEDLTLLAEIVENIKKNPDEYVENGDLIYEKIIQTITWI